MRLEYLIWFYLMTVKTCAWSQKWTKWNTELKNEEKNVFSCENSFSVEKISSDHNVSRFIFNVLYIRNVIINFFYSTNFTKNSLKICVVLGLALKTHFIFIGLMEFSKCDVDFIDSYP